MAEKKMFTTLFLYNMFLVNSHGIDDNSDNHKNNRVECRVEYSVEARKSKEKRSTEGFTRKYISVKHQTNILCKPES